MIESPAISRGAGRRRIILFSGNVTRPSASRRLAERIGAAIVEHLDADIVPRDLVDAGRAFGSAHRRDELPAAAQIMLSELEHADALVIVTPVHNGAYPGLFKHFVDFLDRAMLAGKPILLGASGGSRRHALMVENQLIPLFGFFQAQISAYTIFEAVGQSREDNSEPNALAGRIDLAARHFAHMARC